MLKLFDLLENVTANPRSILNDMNIKTKSFLLNKTLKASIKDNFSKEAE